MAFKRPRTTQEKRAFKFGYDLMFRFGYGHIISVPSRELSRRLTTQDYKVSFITITKYWEALVDMGLATRYMKARIFGVTYKLNKYAFKTIHEEADKK